MAARIRCSAWRRCSALVRIAACLGGRGCRGVDGVQDALGPVELGLEAGSLGRTRTAERTRLQAELDRAQRVLDSIDAAPTKEDDHADHR